MGHQVNSATVRCAAVRSFFGADSAVLCSGSLAAGCCIQQKRRIMATLIEEVCYVGDIRHQSST